MVRRLPSANSTGLPLCSWRKPLFCAHFLARRASLPSSSKKSHTPAGIAIADRYVHPRIVTRQIGDLPKTVPARRRRYRDNPQGYLRNSLRKGGFLTSSVRLAISFKGFSLWVRN